MVLIEALLRGIRAEVALASVESAGQILAAIAEQQSIAKPYQWKQKKRDIYSSTLQMNH